MMRDEDMDMPTKVVLLPGSNFAQRVTSSGTQAISIRECERCDDFLKALTEEVDLPGAIHEGDHQPSSDEILICWPDALEQVLACARDRAGVALRSVLIGVPRGRAVKEAETLGLAAVIDGAAYSQWLINDPKAQVALCGLRRIQRALGAEISPLANETGETHVRYVAPAGATLPRFAGAYLRAWLASWQPSASAV